VRHFDHHIAYAKKRERISALEEMLFSGGSLNLKLLGAGQIESRLQCSTN
jgi:hypothetical protein